MTRRIRGEAIFILLLFVMTLTGCKAGKEQSTPKNPEVEQEISPSEEGTTGGVMTETEEVDEVTLEGMSLDILKNMTVEEKIGQLLFVGLDTLRTDGKTGKLYEISRGIEGKVEAWNPGGVILYSRNLKNPNQTKKMTEKLQEASKIPLFIGTAEEGGEASKITSIKKMKIDPQEDAETIGRGGDRKKAKQTGEQIGSYMKELGFNLNFAPVADVREEGKNPLLGKRSYGTDAELVSEMTAGFVAGIQGEGVCSVLKYFPGQGALSESTQKGAVDIPKSITMLRETEFKPFSAGIEEGADFVMAGHASYSEITQNQIPASLSKLMISEILRNELRFDSVVITDSMNMKAITDRYETDDAAVKAIEAGADMILCPDNGRDAFEGILQAVQDGVISTKRLHESVLRILKVKIKRGIIPMDTNLIQEKK